MNYWGDPITWPQREPLSATRRTMRERPAPTEQTELTDQQLFVSAKMSTHRVAKLIGYHLYSKKKDVRWLRTMLDCPHGWSLHRIAEHLTPQRIELISALLGMTRAKLIT